ncbi:hypothetical protein ACA910_018158 [Epithemia clementina (nom. ined.)]
MNVFQNLQPALRQAMFSSSSRVFASRAMVAAGMLGSATPIVSLCEKKKGEILTKDSEGNIDWAASVSRVPNADFWDDIAIAAGSKVQSAVDTGVPTALSYGFISGFCSGFALKKAGKVAASVLGLGFLAMQALAYNGYITVDHGKIRKDVEGILDLNKDGLVDDKDRAIAMEKLMEVLQFNMPSGGGFVVGFLGGLRSG